MSGRTSRAIRVGDLTIGGGAPVVVQSMTTTDTTDVKSTVNQILRLKEAGCQLVRVAVPSIEAARSIALIREKGTLPVVADIHFDYRLALEAVAAGADKIRINPGNIGSESHVRAVADACRQAGVPIRVGVNAGSLPRDIEEASGVSADSICRAAFRQIDLLQKFDFEDICISLKSSNVPLTVAAYRRMAERTGAPLHIGITETGPVEQGRIKSAVGIGALLLDGIGDTLRVSLTADPVEEVKTALDILQAVGLRRSGIEIISCPTCGRCQIDLIALVEQTQRALSDCDKTLTVAVMGCPVNGPGEARAADVGIAGGQGEGLLFLRGEIVGKCPQERLVASLCELVETLE